MSGVTNIGQNPDGSWSPNVPGYRMPLERRIEMHIRNFFWRLRGRPPAPPRP